MLFADKNSETRTFEENGEETVGSTTIQPNTAEREPTETELFELYEEISETRPGTRDAEIFGKIREWTFSDFSKPAHTFAGITVTELAAWQSRHRINLSSGHIRPAHIDLARGHAWGHVRRDDHANGRHTQYGPPSREELLELMGAAK
jgi:hypothetical protein